MQQRFLLQILLLAQHVSGTTMSIIRSSRVLYSGCCMWHFVLWFSSCWSGVELRVVCPVCRMLQHSTKCHRQQPLYNTLELLMMGIVVPETCWASNKICNKNLCRTTAIFVFLRKLSKLFITTFDLLAISCCSKFTPNLSSAWFHLMGFPVIDLSY